jgi:hypothetical protein
MAEGRPTRLFDQRSVPQRTGHIVEDLGIELLPAEPGALVLAYDLLQKRRRVRLIVPVQHLVDDAVRTDGAAPAGITEVLFGALYLCDSTKR